MITSEGGDSRQGRKNIWVERGSQTEKGAHKKRYANVLSEQLVKEWF